ncbi:hypothetical protein CEUSTIGMA_g10072.t1 [Chlamydomonas eustigma]|uniref:SMC hinge domain-containing protein n=1 Tax=Chlamydomonas eustigma TaxID=1157962 RepID=A0A250XI19_9CHLO|nr:hypothetical protein CEUSTIGMA_g10072.t1 [Chlamydomonas eustigma]|eukprot:GAX82646.1 hypothetical protein CEUSTIGMA_g10072.t1 [Chlamydomonas eustigma]
MYIQEITIEGFKSYAQRVVIPNFDPTFNAITGLNGTGKSNILDSICFVMGIKNLSQVRATNLQELVYKQGQAGVTKATVSITFHNNDPSAGPTGYEDKEYITVTRQIVIGGRNKYLINGHAAQEGRVQDMFHSVQLNVNNPHFLIMQGRINKVCNMKPTEIMSLLEEASGTRMYEKKKEKAMQTMEKKDQKLQEIEAVLNDDIKPAVEKLKKQCSEYNEWAELSSCRERLKRFLVAFDYTECIKFVKQAEADMQVMKAQNEERQATKAQIMLEASEKESMIKDLQTEKELKEDKGNIKELQKEADKLNIKVTTSETSLKNKQETLLSEQTALRTLQAAAVELAEFNPQDKVSKATEARDEAEVAVVAAEHGVEAASREVAGAEAGDGRDESNRSLQERLADTQNAQTACESEAAQADIRAKHLAKQLADVQKGLVAKDKEAAVWQRDLKSHRDAVEECTRLLQALPFSATELQKLEVERERLVPAIRSCQEEIEQLGHQVAGCSFSYTDPRPGFDRSRVHGVVARLVRVLDPASSTALEVTAGGKLYQVVVSDELTAKELLEKGKLAKRVTIIPLNKVQYHEMPSSVSRAAQQLGAGKARPALELVGCSEEVEKAIKYTFGTAFVCEDSGTAKKLAFSSEVHQRCITLQGDDFNPSGLLTGGSRTNQSSVLSSLHALGLAESRLASLKAELKAVDEATSALAGSAKEHKRLTQQLDLKKHALSLLQERMAGSETAQLAASVELLKSELEEAKQKLESSKSKKAELVALAKSLEQEIRDFSKEKGKRLKMAEEKLKKAKTDLEAVKKLLKQKEQRLLEAVAEAESAEKEAVELEAKIKAAAKGLKSTESEVAALQAQVDGIRGEALAATSRLEEHRERLRQCDSEIQGLERERDKLHRSAQDIDVECKRSDGRLKVKRDDSKRHEDHMKKLSDQYKWVLSERDSFGQGDFDFSKQDPAKVNKQYEQAEKRLEELKGKVNLQCMAKLEKAEMVSHKDGFFNNANIIFRTKFVDGVSAVTRTVVQHADRVASGAVHDQEAATIVGKHSARDIPGGPVKGKQVLKDSNR